jgi:hypothetical protein
MNLFELCYFITPIAGAIAGANAAKGHGAPNMVIGICTGLIIGRILQLGISKVCYRLNHMLKMKPKDERSYLLRLAPTIDFLLPVLSPYVSFAISSYAASIIINL